MRDTECGKMLQQEIMLDENTGCIVFDFGIYILELCDSGLQFCFSIDGEAVHDYKLNHRYRNWYYNTVSRTYGRRVSKIGYPYTVPLDTQSSICLQMYLDIPSFSVRKSMEFMIQTAFTPEKPVCGLTWRYDAERDRFSFRSEDYVDDGGGWHSRLWSSESWKDDRFDEIVLQKPEERDGILVYQDVIQPFASELPVLMLI